MPSSATNRRRQAKEQEKKRTEAILAAAATGGTVAAASSTAAPAQGMVSVAQRITAAGADSAQTAALIAALIAAIAVARGGVRWIQDVLSGEFDDRVSDAELEAAAETERQREAAFIEAMRERLGRDIPTALREPDPEAAVEAILEREQRYMEQHDDAAAARVQAALKRRLVKADSPDGAFWILDPSVREHTPDCLAMAAVGWWPWAVLDTINPPVHTGCRCDLLTKNEAIGLGYMSMGADLMSDEEAIARANAIARQYDLGEAVSWRREIPMEDETPHELMELRWNRRYAEGTIWGGRFMPKRGGFAPRISIKDILRRLDGPDVNVVGRGNQREVSAPDPKDVGRAVPDGGMASPVDKEVRAVAGGGAARTLDSGTAAQAAAKSVRALATKRGAKVTPFTFLRKPRDPQNPNAMSAGGSRVELPDGNSAVLIGEREQAILDLAAQRVGSGQSMGDELALDAYDARRLINHELIHNASAISQEEYNPERRPDAFGLEEAVTEYLAHELTIEQLTDENNIEILDAVKRNPNSRSVRGVYGPQRDGLVTVLDYGKVPDEERRDLIEKISMEFTDTDSRIEELAKRVAEAQGVDQQRAVDIVRGALFDYGSKRTNREVLSGPKKVLPRATAEVVNPELGFEADEMVSVNAPDGSYKGRIVGALVDSRGNPRITVEVTNDRGEATGWRYPEPDQITKGDVPAPQQDAPQTDAPEGDPDMGRMGLNAEERELAAMASPAILDTLSDGEGPVEETLRKALNAIGVDPYDLDIEQLTQHSEAHEGAPQSRLNIGGRGASICANSREADFATHVLLPEMLQEKYPELAQRLRETSPRWGWRSGDMPLGLASPDQPNESGMDSPGVTERVPQDEMLTAGAKERPAWWVQGWQEELDRVSTDRKTYADSRAPKPDWLTDDYDYTFAGDTEREDEYLEWRQARRKAEAEWNDDMAQLLHMGVVTPEHAERVGYSEASVSVGVGFGEEQYRPLPERLFHVTTAADEVAAAGEGFDIGQLKTRKEVGRSALGGGPNDRISLSDSEEFAENLAFVMKEGAQAVRGELTIEEMVRQAREGEGANRPWLGEDEQGGLANYLENDGVGVEAMLAREASGDITPEERWRFYKDWLNFRSRAGGPDDPLFFYTTADDMLSVDPEQIKIAEVRPKHSEITGVRLGTGTGSAEWRIPSGDGIKITSFRDGTIDRPTPRTSTDALVRAEAGMASPGVETPEAQREAIDVGGDVQRAADLLAAGYRVQIDQPRTVSILLTELNNRVQAALDAGDNPPNFDVCDIYLPGTNIFCAESQGIPRSQMPQLSGVPTPGSRADRELPKNDKGEVDLSELFRTSLEEEGIGVADDVTPSANLRATQSELNGAKVSGIANAMLNGVKIEGSPLFISSDDYIVDGHHRWAANVGVDAQDGELGDVPQEVQRIDLPITEILDRANGFAEEWGIPQAGVADNRALAKKILEDRGELPEGMESPVEIGGTPFRPEDADDPEGFQRKMEDYQRRMAEAADALGIAEMSNMEQQGIWLSEEDGEVIATPEPSVATDLGDADFDSALAAAAVVGQFYNQDGMALFQYDPEGPGGRFAVAIPEGMDDEEILNSITEGMKGGAGASIMDGAAYFYAHDFDEGLQLADQLAERLGSDAQAQRGTFTLISDEYGDVSYEQALGRATDQASALSARWRMEDGQDGGPTPDTGSSQGDVPEAQAGDAGAVAREPAMASPDPDFPPGGGTEPGQFVAIPGSDAEKIFVGDDVQRAADLLAAGYRVELDQPRTVSTLLDELNRRVKDAIAKGEDAPSINICDISVPKTNLFCAESKGIPRSQMPQLSGIPVPGSRADDLPKNDKGEVDLSDLFREQLAQEGITITDETEGAAYLRATQSELNGPKVAGIAGAIMDGVEIGGAPLFVSSDDYIVDGHHRWAALVGVDSSDGQLGDITMDIQRVDMPILELLDRANRFADEMGIPQAGVEENRALAKQVLAERGELPEGAMASPAASTLLEYYDFGPDSPFWELPVGDRLRLIRAIGMNDWPVPSDDTINNILGGARSTQERFAEVIPETGVATYSPERRQLHSEIIGRSVAGGVSDLLGESHSITQKLREGGIDALTDEDRQFIREAAAVARGNEQPTALFMAGGAASGKTTGLNARPELKPPSSVSVNADDVKDELPEFKAQKEAGERAAAVTTHKESSDVAKMTTAVALDLGLNVVVDGTGNKSIEDFKGRLTKMRDAGYTIDLLVVSLPTDEAVVRATTRATGEGRWVPEPEIRKAHRQVSRNLDALKEEDFIRRMSIVDNSQPYGEPPTEIARAEGGGQLEVLDEDLLDMFWAKMNEPDFDPNDVEAYETTVGLTEAAIEGETEQAEREGGKTPPTEWVTYPSNDWVEYLDQSPRSITPDGWLLDEAQNKIRMLTPEEMKKHGITGATSPAE